MTALSWEEPGVLRRAVYALLIITSAAAMTGRVWSVKSERGKSPLLSANDRSRWATIRALVDHGTFALDRVVFGWSGKRNPEWYTIDLVRHRGRDGRQHYYSSKPPLLPTLLAAQYAVIKSAIGATLERNPFYVVRLMLLANNVTPLVLNFVLLALLVEHCGTTSWGRVFVMGAATWGTYLTTFAVTLNNHLPAAISVMIAVYALHRVFRDEPSRFRWYVLGGLAAAFAVANELPALSLFALLALAFGMRSPTKAVLGFAPAAGLVAAAFFVTTFAAHGSWRPPYAHRQDGPVVAALPPGTREKLERTGPTEILPELRDALSLSGRAQLTPSDRAGRWVLSDPATDERWAVVVEDGQLFVRAWDNWYEYEGSYWAAEELRGVDRGEPSSVRYAFHVLLGHHGVFSLTPLWLLSLAGAGIWLVGPDPRRRAFAAGVLLVSLACLAFYLLRPLSDRNYGGVSCGFRWMFWCIPLWLLCLVPAADAVCRSRVGRVAAWGLLFVSVVSASYASLNPWSHPWLFEYGAYLGWFRY